MQHSLIIQLSFFIGHIGHCEKRFYKLPLRISYIVTCQRKTELLHPIKMQSNKSNTQGQQRAFEYFKTAAGVQGCKSLTLDG